MRELRRRGAGGRHGDAQGRQILMYGKFSKFHIYIYIYIYLFNRLKWGASGRGGCQHKASNLFCGLDPGNLKF